MWSRLTYNLNASVRASERVVCKGKAWSERAVEWSDHYQLSPIKGFASRAAITQRQIEVSKETETLPEGAQTFVDCDKGPTQFVRCKLWFECFKKTPSGNG